MYQERNKKPGFATKGEAKEIINEKKDSPIVVDGVNRIPVELAVRNILSIGTTGSGKSSTHLIPTLLNQRKDDRFSWVVFGTESLYKSTSGYLSNQGFSVQLINAYNIEQSNYYNPLARIRNTQDIRRIS